MDLEPVVALVKHIRSDRSNVLARARKSHIRTRAYTKVGLSETGDGAHTLARHPTSQLVGGNDFHLDVTELTVPGIQHRGVSRVGDQPERRISVATFLGAGHRTHNCSTLTQQR
jgi:hypothetical protein